MNHKIFISHSSKDASIANLICHRLEEISFPCWIAPRDIRHGDWATAIMDGLQQCDVCVVIISENSVASGEVIKELTEATHTCSYIIPFKIDFAELNPRMRYHLGPCHWLDASTPPIEKRINELKERISILNEEDVVYLNAHQLKLKSYMAWPKALFLGREKELAQIRELLLKKSILFLQGMGGMGKSELAKAYAKQFQNNYDTIVFMGYENSLLDTVIGDSLCIENLPPWDTKAETAEEYFHRKMEALRKITSERTLIILDNYDIDNDPHFNEFANGSYHLLVTTRNEHENYPTIKIGPIEDMDAVKELFISCWGKQPKEEESLLIDKILNLVGCHTITVELIAKQMKASRKKPADMLELLRSGGINTHLKERIKQEETAESASSFDFINRLFCFSHLSEECEQLLRYMTLVPYTGIDISFFYDVCQLESYDELNELIAHSWLMLDEDTDILSMHPVIADVVRAQLSPTAANCSTYIKGIVHKIGNLWFKTQEERTSLWPYLASVLNRYPTPLPELIQEYISLSNNSWIVGRYDIAISIAHNTLVFVQKTCPEDYSLIGLCARTLGGCYYNSGDDKNAQPYYELGLEMEQKGITDDSPEEDWVKLATSYQKVGRCAYTNGNYEQSTFYLEESLRLFTEKVPTPHTEGDTLTELERLYIAKEDFETALVWCEKSLDCFQKRYCKEVPNMAYSYTDFGKCYTSLCRYDEAEKALREALRINTKFHGEHSRQTFFAKEALADLFFLKQEHKMAEQLYTELMLQMEQDFGFRNPMVCKLKEKIRNRYPHADF